MKDSIEELKDALNRQNEIQARAIEQEREKVRVSIDRVAADRERIELDSELLKEQQELRSIIQKVLEMGNELVRLVPLIACMGDSQVLILAVLELVVQPLYRVVIKGELDGDFKQALEAALRDIAKMRTDISVYGQVQSGNDTNVAGKNIREVCDDDQDG